MCTLIAGLNQNNKQYFIGFNRDEYYDRNWQPIHLWPNSNIIAGIDQQQGGCWLGLTTNLHFAATTNIRISEKKYNNPYSRGMLVKNFLNNQNQFEQHLIQDTPLNYFNCIFGQLTRKHLQVISKCNTTTCHQKFYGMTAITNNVLIQPWEKQSRAVAIAKSLVTEKNLTHELIFSKLQDETKSEVLPDTGLNSTLEQYLSAIFIKSDLFGTSSATSIIINLEQQIIDIREIGYQSQGKIKHDVQFTLDLTLT